MPPTLLKRASTIPQNTLVPLLVFGIPSALLALTLLIKYYFRKERLELSQGIKRRTVSEVRPQPTTPQTPSRPTGAGSVSSPNGLSLGKSRTADSYYENEPRPGPAGMWYLKRESRAGPGPIELAKGKAEARWS